MERFEEIASAPTDIKTILKTLSDKDLYRIYEQVYHADKVHIVSVDTLYCTVRSRLVSAYRRNGCQREEYELNSMARGALFEEIARRWYNGG